LSGDASIPDLLLKKDDWYTNQRITLMLDTAITQIKPESKQVFTQKGDILRYDKLLLAMGGTPFVPPITGANKKGVFTLRTIQDAQAILEHIKKEGNQVIIIGGGVLGLEAGNALRKQGCKIHVIEYFPRLLPRQMDSEGAKILQTQLEEKEFTFYLGMKTQQITGKKQVDGILLDDGTHIKGGMVLLSAGIRPTVTVAQDLGIDIDRGIKVDDQLQTSLPDIYAAGDLIQHKDRMYGIWPAAEKQGEIAGLNMTGEQRIYSGTTPSNMLKVTGIELFSIGDIDPEGQKESFLQKDKDRYIYKKIVLANNRIIGAIMYGDTQGRNRIVAAIQEKKDITSHLQDLRSFRFDHI
jgi:nitrite reductase (NADH) large subunit